MNKNKYWIIGIILLIGIIASTGVNAYYCYQESVDVQNQTGIDGNCGQNYGGFYSIFGDWTYSGGANILDGNWSTYDKGNVSGSQSTVTIFYKRPIAAMNDSILQVKDEGGIYNISIPIDCWNYPYNANNYLVFKVLSFLGNTNWYCQNGTITFHSLRTYNGNSTIYEEAMYWSIHAFDNSSYTTSFPYSNNAYTKNSTLIYGFTTIDPYYSYTIYNITGITNATYNRVVNTSNTSLSTTLPNGKYYYAMTIYDTLNNSQYYDPNITIDTTYPTIYYNTTTSENGTYTNNATINITVHINDTNLAYVNTTIYNSTGGVVASNNSNGTISKINIKLTDNGYYYFNSTACDLAGNCNSTETRTVLIDYYKYYTANALNANSAQITYNITLNGTTAAYGKVNYNITNGYGAITIKIDNGLYNISVKGNTYTSNITNQNITTDITQTYYLPNYILNIYNGFTNQLITQSVKIWDRIANTNTTITTGTHIYNPTNGVVNLTINSSSTSNNYLNASVIQTISATNLTTYNLYMIPIVYYSFVDEQTLQPFNMSSPDGGIKVQVILADGNTTEYLLNGTISPTNWFFNTTQPVAKIRFLELYTTPNILTIYRTILGQDLGDQNITVYLLNLRTTDVVVYTLQTFDLMSQYINPVISVTKTINSAEQLITSDYADATGKLAVFLINGQQYSLKVLSDNMPTRVIGNFYSDSATAGLVYVRLFEIVGVPVTKSQAIPISYTTALINLSGTPTVYTSYNSTTAGLITLASWYLYNGTNDTSPVLVASTANTSSGIFTYSVPPGTTGNINYYVKLILNLDCVNSVNINVSQCHTPIIYPKALQLNAGINISKPQFENPFTLKWIIFLFLLIVALSLNYKTVSVGSLLLVGLAGFFVMIGWFDVGGAAENGVYVILGLAVLVALIQMFNKGSQR